MTDTTLPAAERIRAFAAAVRAELSDLPAEDVDDLVEGLVGDLTDQADDSDGEIALGDPVAYAQELRSAAGLPERGPVAPVRVPWAARLAARRRGAAAAIRSSKAGAAILDLLVSLRPVWWLLRGFGMFALLSLLLGFGIWTGLAQGAFGMRLLFWMLLLATCLVSVQWGRGRWLPRNAVRHIRTVASVLAILLLPFCAGTLLSALSVQGASVDEGYMPVPSGLTLDGEQVGNLFVYDRDGALVDGAQIYTGGGKPLDLFGAQSRDLDDGSHLWWNGQDPVVVPLRDAQNRPIWNIYPLSTAPIDPTTGEPERDRITAPQPPFLHAPERGSATPTPGTTPPPSPVPTPTPPTPSPVPTPEG